MALRKSIFIAIWFLITTIAWLALEKLIGFHDVYIQYHKYFTNFIMIPYLYIFNRGLKSFRLASGGTVSYLNSFGFGLICTVFVALVSPLALWVFETILNPNFYQSMIQYSVSHKMQTQIQANAYFNHDNYRNLMIYGNIAQGVIFSAIIAFFSSQNKN